ncbi:MAG: SH3 domain-containing protein [Treponema sp.]|nr:SH3 domain-containing protein [Treponema sp.]
MNKTFILSVLFSLLLTLVFTSCSRLGYGVLLWSVDEPMIDSGTVLPVYIKSNIEQIWVVGVPEPHRGGRDYKLEIPINQLEFLGSKRKAMKWAEEFAPYATAYAENLQDGLPIREGTDNNSRRVYRLRLGEVIKILGKARGTPPISTTGDPLPGDWYKVMTNDGVVGYCFSYRLKIFNSNESSGDSSVSLPSVNTETRGALPDPELELILSKTWSAELYLQMVNSRRYDMAEIEKKYCFDIGYETGVARIILPDIERQFTYEKITAEGERTWRFDGTTPSNLQMTLRNNNTLIVQFLDSVGTRRSLTFTSLSVDIDDIIVQENARREAQFLTIYNNGPVFTSNNYGTITLLRSGGLTWTGFESLVPQFIPSETNGTGRINMDLYIASSYSDNFNGAFTLQFSDIRVNNTLYFMYAIDNQSLRLEIIPDFGIEGVTVIRRASPPTVLYFFKDS